VGKVTDPNGVLTVLSYDERNRVKAITNQASGARVQYDYDSNGRLGRVIFAEGPETTFAYNPSGKVTEIRDTLEQDHLWVRRGREPEPGGGQGPGGTLKRSLDLTFDAYNRLKRVVTPDGAYTEYGYNGFGDMTAIRDPRGARRATATIISIVRKRWPRP